jgi:hypothetical protein
MGCCAVHPEAPDPIAESFPPQPGGAKVTVVSRGPGSDDIASLAHCIEHGLP